MRGSTHTPARVWGPGPAAGTASIYARVLIRPADPNLPGIQSLREHSPPELGPARPPASAAGRLVRRNDFRQRSLFRCRQMVNVPPTLFPTATPPESISRAFDGFKLEKALPERPHPARLASRRRTAVLTPILNKAKALSGFLPRWTPRRSGLQFAPERKRKGKRNDLGTSPTRVRRSVLGLNLIPERRPSLVGSRTRRRESGTFPAAGPVPLPRPASFPRNCRPYSSVGRATDS
jgi:hypothetical protein